MRKLTRRSAAIALTALVGLSAAGAAWAAWNLTGSGTAQAQAGSVVNLEVTSAGLADGSLSPGNPTAVKLSIKNENKFPVKITNIVLTNLTSTIDGCIAKSNVDIITDAALPAVEAVTIPAATEGTPATKSVVWNGALRMKADPVNACQGAGFQFNVHLDAVSAAS
jgi:hypothetical protein